jgi:hypothetical protein
MKWGQQNQRFGTMRLRGEKDEKMLNIKRNNKIQKIFRLFNYENISIF